MKKIYYVAPSGLPHTASGIRIDRISDVLEKNECVVEILSTQTFRSEEAKAAETLGAMTVRDDAFANETVLKYKERFYRYESPVKNSKLQSIKNLKELSSGSRTFQRVKEHCKKEKPYAIIVYDGSYGIVKKLLSYCRKNHIRLFADITEWYEMDKSKSLAGKIVVRTTDKRIRLLDHKLDGVIAISPYLHQYYQSKGGNCIRIPPLMPVESGLEIKRYTYDEANPTMNFVYAGSPGGKDILIPFVRALQFLNRDGIKARLDIIGINEEYFSKFSELDHNLKGTGVFAHGRLPHAKTLETVKKADFGILFRHDKRYAKAGFATKFAECMSVGVPMICNSIGGCDAMIEDEKNGFLTDSCKTETLVALLQQIMEIPEEKILQMKKNAYEFAKTHFSGEFYASDLLKMMRLENNDVEIEGSIQLSSEE